MNNIVNLLDGINKVYRRREAINNLINISNIGNISNAPPTVTPMSQSSLTNAEYARLALLAQKAEEKQEQQQQMFKAQRMKEHEKKIDQISDGLKQYYETERWKFNDFPKDTQYSPNETHIYENIKYRFDGLQNLKNDLTANNYNYIKEQNKNELIKSFKVVRDDRLVQKMMASIDKIDKEFKDYPYSELAIDRKQVENSILLKSQQLTNIDYENDDAFNSLENSIVSGPIADYRMKRLQKKDDTSRGDIQTEYNMKKNEISIQLKNQYNQKKTEFNKSLSPQFPSESIRYDFLKPGTQYNEKEIEERLLKLLDNPFSVFGFTKLTANDLMNKDRKAIYDNIIVTWNKKFDELFQLAKSKRA